MMHAANAVLFAGQPSETEGLSNEDVLVALCPEQFKVENEWSIYAMMLYFQGGQITQWSWKSNDLATKQHQLACFKSVLQTFGLRHIEREAIAGWMLSEMLTVCPEYEPIRRE
jgi:hypothetical protein